MRTLAQCTKLAHEVTLYIPSTANVNTVDKKLAAQVLRHVKEQFSAVYGGATQNAPAKGSWMSDAVGLVEEKITPVTVYVSDLSDTTQNHLLEMAEYVKVTMSQESVMMVVDGQGYLV